MATELRRRTIYYSLMAPGGQGGHIVSPGVPLSQGTVETIDVDGLLALLDQMEHGPFSPFSGPPVGELAIGWEGAIKLIRDRITGETVKPVGRRVDHRD